MFCLQCPFRQRKERITREEVEHRVQEEREKYTEKFSADAQLFCTQVYVAMNTPVALHGTHPSAAAGQGLLFKTWVQF